MSMIPKTRVNGQLNSEDRIVLCSFWHNNGVWQTDTQTDRQTEML